MIKKILSFFKKEKPYIRFYSVEPGVVDIFPIVKSSDVKRQFMTEDQVGDQPGTLSSKNCPGIKKIISVGWIVTAPADFAIQTNGDGVSIEWGEPYKFTKVSDGISGYITWHTRSQTEPLLDDPENTLKTVIKVETPWRVEASDDVLLLILPVTYNNEDRFQAATGILDPKYGHLINIQLFWKVLQGKTTIKAGTPLCQIIPINRRAISTTHYDVTIENANDVDKLKEREFNYASNCTFTYSDKLSSRLARTIKILNKYKKGDML